MRTRIGSFNSSFAKMKAANEFIDIVYQILNEKRYKILYQNSELIYPLVLQSVPNAETTMQLPYNLYGMCEKIKMNIDVFDHIPQLHGVIIGNVTFSEQRVANSVFVDVYAADHFYVKRKGGTRYEQYGF